MKRATTSLLALTLTACAPNVGDDGATATAGGADDDDDDDGDGDDGTGDGDGDGDGDGGSDPSASGDGDSDGDGSDGDGTGGDDETSAGSADSGDDSDSGSDTAGTWVGPCPPYSGLADVGSSWDQSTTAAYEAAMGYSYDIHREVTDVEVGATTRVTLVTTTDATGPNYTAMTVTTTLYECDDEGAWILEYESETEGSSGGTPFDVWSVTTYEPAWLGMPWDIAVGSEWSTASTLTTVTEYGPTDTVASQDYEVTGTDSVEVPAGTFDVLVIDYSGGGSSGTFYTNDEAGGITVDGDIYEMLAVDIVPWS